ncbi:MAG: 3-phosphoglycerate dehydrogenase [Acidimicrobiia bacterium]|nr:3-phosphoglycerate dehydrogenase [Acidimicrobiia bacterium]
MTSEAAGGTRLRALVTAPLRGPGFAALGEMVDVVYEPWLEYTPIRLYDPPRLAQRLAETHAELLICEADFCSGEVMELPLRAIVATRGEPSNVDVPGATAAGIPVLYTPGRNADAVAELTVGLLFALNRRIVPADRDVRTGQVFTETLPYQRYRSDLLAGQTFGIVGLGAVGRAVRRRMAGLGLQVIAHDPYVGEAQHSLAELLAAADIVSMHAPPTAETAHMMGASQFAAMRPGAVYLNCARAALHDLDALVAALESGHLGGCALDHFDGEQLPEGHPLCGRDDVVLTPHIGGASYHTEQVQASMVADDLRRLLSGERPAHIANPEVLA